MTEVTGRVIETVTGSRVWRSFFRHGWPNTETNRALTVVSNVFLHLHPVKVRRHGLRFSYTLGLGGLSFFSFLVLAATGALLMLYYIPSTSQAYDSMNDLQFAVTFGRLWRNVHRWAAHLMVASVAFHMCRVFYTAAYKPPREFNWLVGLGLFMLTLALSFTGYLLPWDQLAFWAITVGTNIGRAVPMIGEQLRFILLGGNTVGQNALLRFYTLHVFIVPAAAMVLMAVHFWRVRKDGGISGPPRAAAPVSSNGQSAGRSEEMIFELDSERTYQIVALPAGSSLLVDKEPDDSVMTVPHLVVRELTLAVAITALLLAAAFWVDAPLEEIADPTKTPNPAKAPWYFLGLQEMVSWANPFWGGVLLPGLFLLTLVALPYIDPRPDGVGVWFHPKRKLALALFTAWVLLMAGVIIVGFFFRGPGWQLMWPWAQVGH